MDNAWDQILSEKTAHKQRMRLLFSDNSEQDYLSSRQLTPFHKAVLSLHGREPSELEAIAKLCGTAEINSRDKDGVTALGWAASRGDVEAVRCLLRLGADPNLADIRLYSPLMRSLDPDCTRLLIEAGAAVDFKDTTDQTALLFALRNPRCAEVLLSHGADVNIAAKSGFTPIAFSIYSNAPESLRILLSRGADYRAVMRDGSTIVHLGVNHATVETLNVLAEFPLCGLDDEARDEDGRTATAIAKTMKAKPVEWHEAVERFLQAIKSNKGDEVDEVSLPTPRCPDARESADVQNRFESKKGRWLIRKRRGMTNYVSSGPGGHDFLAYPWISPAAWLPLRSSLYFLWVGFIIRIWI